MRKKIFVSFVALMICTMLLLAACSNNSPAPQSDTSQETETQYIAKEDLKADIEAGGNGYIILDVRKAADYETEHIQGAYSGDVDPAVSETDNDTTAATANLKAAIKAATGSETGNSDSKFVLVCYSGKKYAAAATGIMTGMGIASANIYTLEGGHNGWKEAGNDYTALLQANAETVVEQVAKDKVFVSAEWLNSLIAGEQPQSANYVIIEASWGEAGDEYKTAHIPGAVHLNTDLIEEDVYWNIRTPEEIEQVLTDFGVTKDTVVVAYGNGSGAARLAFVCLWAGVEEVHLLDGGYSAWLAANYGTEAGIIQPTPVAAFGASVPAHPEFVITWPADVIAAQQDDNFRLVSIRSWEEFTGETSGYSYIDRAGEPQGAVWGHDEEDYHQADGTVKPLAEIESSLWAEWDITKANDIAFYCGTGWRACIPFLLCYENGWRNVQLYDGGWFVWQMDESLPVQTGDPR